MAVRVGARPRWRRQPSDHRSQQQRLAIAGTEDREHTIQRRTGGCERFELVDLDRESKEFVAGIARMRDCTVSATVGTGDAPDATEMGTNARVASMTPSARHERPMIGRLTIYVVGRSIG